MFIISEHISNHGTTMPGSWKLKIQDKLEVKGQNQEGIAKGRPYVSQWLLSPSCIWK